MMIVCFRPQGFRRDWFARYCHLWTKQAGLHRDAVVQQELTDESLRQAWDRVNITPGRAVIWVDPTFGPHQSFFEELDYFLREKFRVVVQRRYEGTFQPKGDVPVRWGQQGIAPFPLIFQLAGQRALTLPVHSLLPKGHLHWLSLTEHRFVARVEQYFCGTRELPLMRSVLGTSYPKFWGEGDYCQHGRLVFGESRHILKRRLRNSWLQRIDAWEAWHNVKTDPTSSTFSTLSSASADQDG